MTGVRVALVGLVVWFIWLLRTEGSPIRDGIVNGGVPWAFFASAASLFVLTVLLHTLALAAAGASAVGSPRRGLYYFFIGQDGRVSTSKLQLMLWTYAIAFALLAAVLSRSTLDGALTNTYLLLLGIPVIGATGASVITTQKVQSGQIEKPPAVDSTGAPVTDPPAPLQGLAQVVADDEGRGDIGDFQYFVFNLVALTSFFIQLLPEQGAVTLPVIPEVLVALTGASAFAYLAKKGSVNDSPVVTSVYPTRSAVGTQVTIRGAHFIGPAGANAEVLFGGVAATAFATMTDSTLVVTVPGTSDRLADVVVVTAGGLQTEPVPFEIVSTKPTVKSVVPTALVVNPGGDPIEIKGFGFMPIPGSVNVVLNGIPLAVTQGNATRIVATGPTAAAPGLVMGAGELVVIDTLGQQSDPSPVTVLYASVSRDDVDPRDAAIER